MQSRLWTLSFSLFSSSSLFIFVPLVTVVNGFGNSNWWRLPATFYTTFSIPVICTLFPSSMLDARMYVSTWIRDTCNPYVGIHVVWHIDRYYSFMKPRAVADIAREPVSSTQFRYPLGEILACLNQAIANSTIINANWTRSPSKLSKLCSRKMFKKNPEVGSFRKYYDFTNIFHWFNELAYVK